MNKLLLAFLMNSGLLFASMSAHHHCKQVYLAEISHTEEIDDSDQMLVREKVMARVLATYGVKGQPEQLEFYQLKDSVLKATVNQVYELSFKDEKLCNITKRSF